MIKPHKGTPKQEKKVVKKSYKKLRPEAEDDGPPTKIKRKK